MPLVFPLPESSGSNRDAPPLDNETIACIAEYECDEFREYISDVVPEGPLGKAIATNTVRKLLENQERNLINLCASQ